MLQYELCLISPSRMDWFEDDNKDHLDTSLVLEKPMVWLLIGLLKYTYDVIKLVDYCPFEW